MSTSGQYIKIDKQSTQNKGVKHDQNKADYSLIDPVPQAHLAVILSHGALKYGRNNWRYLENFNERYYAALMRHLEAWRMGEKYDPDSGELHLAHAYANLHFLIWKQNEGLATED